MRRATMVVVRGTTPAGRVRVVEAEGFEARAFQHELDHLEGQLILDRLASASTDVFRRKRYAPGASTCADTPATGKAAPPATEEPALLTPATAVRSVTGE